MAKRVSPLWQCRQVQADSRYTQPEVYKLSLASGNTVIRQNSTGESVWEMGDRVFNFPGRHLSSKSLLGSADLKRGKNPV